MAEDEVNENEDESAEEGDGEEGLPLDDEGKGPNKLIIIVGGIILLIIIGGAVAFFTGAFDGLLGKDGAVAEEKVDEKKKGKDGKGVSSGPAFMEIPDLIVNLSSTSKQPRFLKLKIQIEVEGEEDLAAVQAVAPRVIDHFQTYLRELRVNDLKGSAGIYRLRQELIRRVNSAAYPVKVKDVLFQEILIQ